MRSGGRKLHRGSQVRVGFDLHRRVCAIRIRLSPCIARRFDVGIDGIYHPLPSIDRKDNALSSWCPFPRVAQLL